MFSVYLWVETNLGLGEKERCPTSNTAFLDDVLFSLRCLKKT